MTREDEIWDEYIECYYWREVYDILSSFEYREVTPDNLSCIIEQLICEKRFYG